MTPSAVAQELIALDVDQRTAIRMLINRYVTSIGLPAPWDTPTADQLPALDGIEAVGEVHQRLLGGQDANRGRQGSYYTPDLLARSIARFSLEVALDQLGDEPEDVLLVLAVDPACGAGVILVAAARYLAREYAARATGTPEPADSVIRMALPVVIEECCYGIDLDPIAVDLTKSWLWIEAGARRPITWLDDNIGCGDPLDGYQPPKLAVRRPHPAAVV